MAHQLRCSIILRVVFLAFTIVGPVSAQSARIGGLVQDEGGDPIRGATITALNDENGTTFTASTDDKGRFAMLGLRPGMWRFTAEAPGFSPSEGEAQVRAQGALNPALSFTLREIEGVVGPLGNVSVDDLQAALSAADALFDDQQWDEAIAAYRAVLDDTPALAVVNLQIGAAYRRKGDFPGALAAYGDLLEADADNGSARVGIAMAHLESGNAAEAEAALLPAVQVPDARPDVLYTLGEIKKAQGLAADAVQWYQRSIEADPSWGKPRYRLAEAAIGRGDTQAASELLAEVIAVDPVSPEAALAKTELEQLGR